MSTKEIVVYSDVERNIRITNTEKLLILDELENNSGVDHVHFIAFAEGCDDIKFGNTNIPSLMLKNISDYIWPITNGDNYNISLQFNKPISSTDGKKWVQIGTDNQINVYGFHFNNSKQNIRNISINTALETSVFKERILSGTYSLKINNKYFQQTTHLRVQKKSLKIMFHDEDSTINSIALITKYVLHLDRYYNDCIYYLYQTVASSYIKSLTLHINTTKLVKNGAFLFMDDIYPNSLHLSDSEGSIDISSFFDIINRNIWNIYSLVRLYGKNDKRVIAAVKNEIQKQKIHKREYMRYIKNQELLYIHSSKTIIANRLFGKSLSNLTVDENNVMELTYKKNIEYDEFLRSCTCRHINLLKAVRNKNTPEWEELKKIINNNSNEMLKCSLCDMPVMCPHAYDKIENGDLDDVKYKDNILRKYSGKAPILDTHYCKICGGVLYKIFMEVSDDFKKSEEITDILQMRTWKIVKSILVKRVVFNVVTGINKLVTSIVEVIMPYIEDTNKNLRKSKTNTMEIVNDSLVVYIYIYTYALIVRIISHNKNEIKFNLRDKIKKGASESGNVNSKELQRLMGNALSMIIQDSDSVLKKISNITTGMIKPLFINAYKDILKTFVIEIETDTILSPEHVINSTEYIFIYLLKKKYDKRLKYTDIKSVLNVNIEEIPNLDNILDNVLLPDSIWKLSLNKNKPGYYNNTKYINLNSEYVFLSYMHLLNYSKKKIFKTNILTSVQYEEHANEYYRIKAIENSLYRTQQNRSIVVKHKYNFVNTKREAKNTGLSRYYCNNGKKHEFNIHVYEKKQSVLNIKTKSLREWLLDEDKNKEMSTHNYTGVKCSLCNVFLSNAYDGNNDSDIISSILNNENLIDFYVYYTNRCPVEKAHIYINGICSKCSVTKNMLYEKNTEYYEKYVNTFRTRTLNRELPVIEAVQPIVEDKNYKPWFPINTIITEASSIFNISINIMSNIGSIEGLDYKNIENGILIPEEKYKRVLVLDSYINSFIIDYEMLRNSNTEKCQYIEHLTKLYDGVDFSKFPDLPFNYYEKKVVYEKNKLEYTKMSNFILNTLLTYILHIYKYYENDEYKKAAKDFSVLSIKRIVDNEYRISNHGVYFRTLVEEDDLFVLDEEMEEVVDKEEFNPFDNTDMDTGIKNFVGKVKID